MSPDLYSDDLNSLSNEKLFVAILKFTVDQPTEGWRLEYTEQWDDSALKEITAFAHSFGGLLIVGVRKGKRDTAPEVVGVLSIGEYKTKIASSIAANISPVPTYNVYECHEPGAPTKKLCVVRVRESKLLHLVTKKDLQPVYVRNEDESRPANAEQLRMLITREREAPMVLETLDRRANELQASKVVRFDYKDQESSAWHLSPAQYSQTLLKLEMIPVGPIDLELDMSHERTLLQLISKQYSRVPETVRTGSAIQAEVRAGRSYEFLWYHKALKQEGRWRVLSTGEIGHATQVGIRFGETGPSEWSIVDVARYLIHFSHLGMRWWKALGYFAEGYLYAQLNVPGLTVLRHPDGYFTGSFDYDFYRPGRAVARPSIRKDAIVASPSAGTGADAVVKLDYFGSPEKQPRIVTSLLNQLLRPLGFGVVWELLQYEIEHLVSLEDDSAAT